MPVTALVRSMSTQVPVVMVPTLATTPPLTAGAVPHVTVDSVHASDTRYQSPPFVLPSVTNRRSFTDCGAFESPVRVKRTRGRYSAVGLCSFNTVVVP